MKIPEIKFYVKNLQGFWKLQQGPIDHTFKIK
jgi:hypothetical protein